MSTCSTAPSLSGWTITLSLTFSPHPTWTLLATGGWRRWLTLTWSIEYLKGTDNKVANTLSRVSVRLDKETVDEILERAKNCMAPRAETDYPRLVQQAEIMEEDFVIQVRAIADEEPAMKKLQQADWPMLQRHDPVL